METYTVLFTDVDGSTALLRRVGPDAYEQVLADHHALIRSALGAHGGREADAPGDGFFAAFSSPRECVAAALQMQQAIEAHDWPAGEQVRARVGIHVCEASETAAGLVGPDVRRAARVAAVAYGGQVLVSEAAAVLVRDSLPPGAALTDLGVHRLNDLGRPERLFQLDAAGLRAEFPPLRSLGSAALPNNLPAQLATFIGRGRELAEVRALVESSRLVTLTGAGGCGKTRLGLQVAAELLDGSGDGVWLAELAAVVDQDAVAPAIAGALGIAGQPGRAVAETLLDALAPQDILIVLDNCEHLIDACAKTAELILQRCPRAQLLATSREPLGIGGETVYRVPSLSLPGPDDNGSPAAGSDAAALFVDRARTQGVSLAGDEQAAELVASVCRRLDGMPLAIELAAARLRSLSLASLHDRLDQRFRLLTGGSRTALARQQTLRATVEWSYSLLTGAEQLLLRRLSVFPESFGLEAAEAVCGFGELDALDVAGLLGSLADKSLVGAEPAGTILRYRLLETIRQFAAERLAEAGEDEAAAAAAAHSACFLSVAEAAASHLTGPDQGRWFARLDAEQANLRRAAEHAAGDPEGTARVLRFGVALRRYWMARYRDEEARRLLLPALQRPDARADPRLFGAALVTAVLTTRGAAGSGTARQLGEQALEFARQAGDERLLIESLAASCEACYFAGEAETGRPLGQEAVERARHFGDDVLLGESLMEYLLCSDPIDPAGYRQLFAEALACTRRSGDQLISRYLYNNAGVQALWAGDIPAARALLDAAASAMRAIGEDSPILSVNVGWVLRQEGDPDAARSKFGAALRTARRNGDHSGIGYASLGLACLAADRGDWRQAGQLHGVAQAFLDRVGEPWQDPEVRYRQESLEQVRVRLGDEQADLAYAEGVALSVDDAHELARAQLTAPGPRQPPEPPGLAHLSARERELVILVARGATDAQIAERLYISISTVRSHLDRIRDKTGCRRRADLTRLALQAGLV